MIVKAKPKFPQQSIPKQDDYEILNQQIRNFDNEINKRMLKNNKINFN
jgi:hypothetical protein